VPPSACDGSLFRRNNFFCFCLLARPPEWILPHKPVARQSSRRESGSFLSSLALILAFFPGDGFNKLEHHPSAKGDLFPGVFQAARNATLKRSACGLVRWLPEGVELHLLLSIKPHRKRLMSIHQRAPYALPHLALATGLPAALGLVFFAALILSACSSDPNLRKQKFVTQGDAYFKDAKYAEAHILYARALQIDPRYVVALYKSAQSSEHLGNWNTAYQELLRTVELEPENWPAQLDLGKIYLGGGKLQEAKERALLILHGNPKDVDAEMLLSDADGALGNQKDALSEAREAVNLAPDRSIVYVNLALVEEKSGAYTEAESNLQKAQSLDPTIGPRMLLGSLYQKQKRNDDARKQFEAAIQAEPKNVVPRTALATLYFAEGQLEQAEKVLADAKSQMPDVPAAYRMLGDFYIARNDSDKALAEFSSLVASHPNDLGVKKTYVQLLILAHKLDEAVPLNDAILKSAPNDVDARILRGQIQVQQQKADDAILTLQQVLQYSQDNAAGHLQLGYAYQLKGNSNQAETEWRKVAQLQPNAPEAWRALAGLAAQRRDWHELESIGTRLINIAPNATDGYILHSTARANQGDGASAEADLNRLIQSAPQSPVGYIQLGLLRFQQKRWTEADALFHKALARDPGSLQAQEALANIDFQRGQPAVAVKRLQEEFRQSPGNGGLAFLLGQAQVRNSQPADAEQSFSKAVQLAPSNISAISALAALQAARGETDAAISSYNHAIQVAPTNAEFVVSLGAIYEGKGDWQTAQTDYQKALAIQPDNAYAANNLAYLLLEHGGDVNVALSLAQTARRGLGDSANSADTLGWAYFHTGAYSVAVPLLEDAVKRVPANPTYHYHLGMVYQKLNDPTHARSAFESAIKVKPDSPAAQAARKALSELAGT
jgi:tetratricopeptide (TPR) repeat protein